MNWKLIGESIGAAVGRACESVGLGDAIRAHYAKEFGVCRTCGAALGGPSPEQICEPCHAAEALARGLGQQPPGEA
jgi:hypothetical protein